MSVTEQEPVRTRRSFTDEFKRDAVESLTSGAWNVRAWRYEPTSGVVGGYGNYVDGMLRGDTLGYDDNGRLTSDCRISESPEGVEADWDSCAAGVPKLEYSYDRAGQLTAAAWSDNPVPTAGITAWGYTYDNRGTRSAATVTDTTGTHATAYDYNNAAQLTASSSTTGGVNATYGYDKAGRRTSRTDTAATVTSTYDPFGRLKGVDGDDPQYRYYGADGHLEAISTNGPGQTPDVDLFWDPASPGGVPQVLDVTLFGSLSIRSAFAGERLNLDAGGSNQLWYSYDVAGSAIGDGQDYNPNGERIDDNPANFFNYRGELNLTPDLVHLRNRDYDPETATFTTPDPMDGVDGTATVGNPYHYADNDPLNKVDPTGMRPGDEDLRGTESEAWICLKTLVTERGWAHRHNVERGCLAARYWTDLAVKSDYSVVTPGENNAMRHLVWSALVTYEAGVGAAQAVHPIHEVYGAPCPASPADCGADNRADAWNNSQGISYGAQIHGKYGTRVGNPFNWGYHGDQLVQDVVQHGFSLIGSGQLDLRGGCPEFIRSRGITRDGEHGWLASPPC